MYSDKLLFRFYRYTLGSSINYFKLLFLGARPLNGHDDMLDPLDLVECFGTRYFLKKINEI